MPKGGKRPGAGRPSGRKNTKTLALEEAKAFLRERVLQEIGPLIQAQLDLAKGVWIEDIEKGRIYQKKPDKSAAELLLAHTIGKPTEQIQKEEKITLLLDLFPSSSSSSSNRLTPG